MMDFDYDYKMYKHMNRMEVNAWQVPTRYLIYNCIFGIHLSTDNLNILVIKLEKQGYYTQLNDCETKPL